MNSMIPATGIPSFIVLFLLNFANTAFFCFFLFFFFFKQIEGLWQVHQASLLMPFFSSSSCSLCVSVTFCNPHNISNFSLLLDLFWWSVIVIFDVTLIMFLRLRWWLAILAMKCLLIKVLHFFRHNAIAHLIDYGGSEGKASAYNAGDPGSIPGSGRSPGEGNGNPLQYSCLENPMVWVAW